MKKAYSTVELLLTLAASVAVLVVALATLVTVVRASTTANRVAALDASIDFATIRILDDIRRAGSGGTPIDVPAVVDDEMSLHLTIPTMREASLRARDIADDEQRAHFALSVVTWRIEVGDLVRTVCTAAGEACRREIIVENARSFRVSLLDDRSLAGTGPAMTRVAFSLRAADVGERGDTIEREVIDSGRMRGGI